MGANDRQRKVTVILAADAVGFSKMMGDDEERTLHNLDECRSIADTKVKELNGRIFGGAGDSIIAEFPSAVAAVNCASQIQDALAARNAGKPSDEQMWFRIGVNLGDVIVDQDNLYGDGVNISARLEAMADPGGVCVSGSVYDLVHSKVPLTFESLGFRKLKNISNPIQVYRVLVAPEPAGRISAVESEEPGYALGHELEVRRWTDLISLVAVLIIIGVAFWFYIVP